MLKKVRDFLGKQGLDEFYALTLHRGANFITSYMVTEDIHLYLNHEDFQEIISQMQDRIILKQLVRGGNVHFVRPHYENSVFRDAREIATYRVISNLQLYLDLYNSAPRGREQVSNDRISYQVSGHEPLRITPQKEIELSGKRFFVRRGSRRPQRRNSWISFWEEENHQVFL